MSIINSAVESVMDLIDGLELFALITRGAMGTDNCLCCEVGPSGPEAVYMDKNQYIILDLTINGKHDNLQTLSETMNGIHESPPPAQCFLTASVSTIRPLISDRSTLSSSVMRCSLIWMFTAILLSA